MRFQANLGGNSKIYAMIYKAVRIQAEQGSCEITLRRTSETIKIKHHDHQTQYEKERKEI